MAYESTDGGTGAGGAEPGASDSLRTFGAVVQALREHAGLSREEFGTLVGYSKHTVASVEQGRRMPDRDFVERAEPILGNTGALRRAAPHLSRQAGLAGLASWFRQWARLEAQAVTLWTYECRVIPGLLQTERYARAVTESVPPVKDEEQVMKQVAARLERQQLFERRPPIAFSFIIEQALVERGTGGPDVMRELLDSLLERSSQFNVELQITPRYQPDHAGFDGPLMLLESPDNKWFGYAEGQRGGMLISDPKEVSITLQRYAKLRSQALNSEDSRGLLKQLRGAL
ncbi:helix-turn-helix domain-containing protein [Streptomyces luteogriseus]|uniref:helix-turn-helix domain-containing protein n=1 Tax=Streptomyces luteogriseus TaxID=68233 RepID=UPI0036AF3FC1